MNEYDEQESMILDALDRFLEVEAKPYVHELERTISTPKRWSRR